jgi:histidine triad (HIT) family protein
MMEAMRDCLFCKIAAGDVPAPMVFEDERSIAFLDHRPLFPGHCLLIPREHFETIVDLPPADIAPLFSAAQLLCRAVEEAMEAEGSFLAINNRISQSVPHLHVHIVPRRKKDGLKGFFWPRGKYCDETEVESVQTALRNALKRLQKPRLAP